MNWFIVWSIVTIGPGPLAEVEYRNHFFGPFTNQQACEAMATLAPLEPTLQMVEPHIENILSEDFVCVEVLNQEPFAVQ